MDFLRKNKITLAACTYLILVALFFYFIIRPLQQKITGKASEIQQEKIDQDITKKKIATVSVMEKDYEKYKENEENLNVMIAQSQDVEFIKELERLAEETGNKIEFKIQEKKGSDAKDGPGILSMQIALEGSYQSLLDFVHKLENGKNYVNILSFRSEKISLVDDVASVPADDMAGGKKAGTKNVLNSILDIAVYIKK